MLSPLMGNIETNAYRFIGLLIWNMHERRLKYIELITTPLGLIHLSSICHLRNSYIYIKSTPNSPVNLKNGTSSLQPNQPNDAMKVIKKIAYILLALSLLPVLTTYFAYGNEMEMVFFVVTLLFFLGLFYLVFATSKRIAAVVLLFGVGLYIIQLTQLNQLWFDNEGGDPRVPIVFTLQSIFTLIVLYLLKKDSKCIPPLNTNPPKG